VSGYKTKIFCRFADQLDMSYFVRLLFLFCFIFLTTACYLNTDISSFNQQPELSTVNPNTPSETPDSETPILPSLPDSNEFGIVPNNIKTIKGQSWKFSVTPSSSLGVNMTHTSGSGAFDSGNQALIYDSGTDIITATNQNQEQASANVSAANEILTSCDSNTNFGEGKIQLASGVVPASSWCYFTIDTFWSNAISINFTNVLLNSGAAIYLYDRDWNYLTSYDNNNLPPSSFTSLTSTGLIIEFGTGATDTTSKFDMNWMVPNLAPSNLMLSTTNFNISKGSELKFTVVGGVAPYKFSFSDGGNYIQEVSSHVFKFKAPINANNFSLAITDSKDIPNGQYFGPINLTEPYSTLTLVSPSLSNKYLDNYIDFGGSTVKVYSIPETTPITIRFNFDSPLAIDKAFTFSYSGLTRNNAIKGIDFTTNEPIQAYVGDTYVDLQITPIANNFNDVDRFFNISAIDSTYGVSGSNLPYFAIVDSGNSGSFYTLDTSFNSIGKVYTGNNTYVNGLDLNSVGDIFTILNDFVTSSFSTSYLKKYDKTTGALYSGFGTGGSLSRSGSYIHWHGIKVLPDDSIVTGGYQEYSGRDAPKLWKWTTAGNADNTFGSSGVATYTGFPGIEVEAFKWFYNATTSKFIVPGAQYDNYIATVRFNSNGSVDSTFNGGTGKFTFNSLTKCWSFKAIQNSVGKIYQLGQCRPGGSTSNTDVVLWRLNSDGTLDTSFQTSGYKIISSVLTTGKDEIAKDFIIDASDKIYLLFEALDVGNNTVGIIQRLNEDGTFDSSFNSNQNVEIRFNNKAIHVGSLALDSSSNRIYVTGYIDFFTIPSTTYKLERGALWAFNTNGTVSNIFGSSGVYIFSTANEIQTNYTSGFFKGNSTSYLKIDSEGRLIVGGIESSNGTSYTQGVIWVLKQ